MRPSANQLGKEVEKLQWLYNCNEEQWDESVRRTVADQSDLEGEEEESSDGRGEDEESSDGRGEDEESELLHESAEAIDQ